MAELRTVDPRVLVPNPSNPRRTAVPQPMQDQLIASIKAVGIIQPPLIREFDGKLTIVAGNRRAAAAVAAGLTAIDVLVCDPDEATDAMRSVSENLIRASMTSVDIWRATETLEKQGWNEQGIADALALPPRTVRRLKLLAHLHPAMLDFMASGSMPSEDQLRTIAAATREEQAQVWKKHKPKKGTEVYWHQVAHALAKRRIPISAAKFDADTAAAYGIVWEDDLFAPAGEDGRYTTQVENFFAAQQQWLQDHLPERGTLLPTDEWGRPTLPKKAEHVQGKPTKSDLIGHYLDPCSGEVQTTVYRLVETKKPAKMANGKADATDGDDGSAIVARTRPLVTAKGHAIIGDLRTDALHEALQTQDIPDETMIALLVLAFGGKNVGIQSGAGVDKALRREQVALSLAREGFLAAEPDAIRTAAREMLTIALSCRDNMTNSGPVARIAGDAIRADLRLPNMATEEFLSCLSKNAIEAAATAAQVRVEVRGKDTRARMIERFKTGTYHYPAARFELTKAELKEAQASANRLAWIRGGGAVQAAGDFSDADDEGAANGTGGEFTDEGQPDDPADDASSTKGWNGDDDAVHDDDSAEPESPIVIREDVEFGVAAE